MSDNFEKIENSITLEGRMYVMNSVAIIDAIIEAGYREEKGWGDNEDKQLEIIDKCAKELTVKQLELMKLPRLKKKLVPILTKEEKIEHDELLNKWETESTTMTKEEIKRFTILDKKHSKLKNKLR